MQQTALEVEEEALGRWPRRLLHVPSLTSYEWKPGNIYGSWTEPSYNAITYTWGRWRLEETDQPSVEALGVLNTPWKIPRVQPVAFTTAQMIEILQRATKFYEQQDNPSIPKKEKLEPVEFVWLDVACIDQRSGEPRSAAEIGRQALIFKNARQVFIWLTTIPTSNLSNIFKELMENHEALHFLFSHMAAYNLDQTPALTKMYSCIQTLVTDPWFTSLWTLQEAYLRPDAVLFSREGDAIISPELDPYHHTFRNMLVFFEAHARQKSRESTLPLQYFKTQKLLRDSGLAALTRMSALSAYTASGSRTATKDVDRFYGIQQIFGFRLGISSLQAQPGVSYTHDELEIQFGQHLLQEYPVLSQMHIFTTISTVGKGWLVSRSSIVPPDLSGYAKDDYPGLNHTEIPLCKLSVREVRGSHWGYFSGKLCTFKQLHTTSLKSERSSQTWVPMHLEETPDFPPITGLTVHLDKISEIPSISHFTFRDSQFVPQGTKQVELRHWLIQEFVQIDEVVVLLLGSHRDTHLEPESEDHTVVAILLLRYRETNGFEYYRRIGVCSWDPRSRKEINSWKISASSADVLGEIPWEEREGYFG